MRQTTDPIGSAVTERPRSVPRIMTWLQRRFRKKFGRSMRISELPFGRALSMPQEVSEKGFRAD
jgi:hypothetical protein